MRAKFYKVVCYSMYDDDLTRLEATVIELKRRGWTRANRSHLVRIALSRLDEAALTEIVEQQLRVR